MKKFLAFIIAFTSVIALGGVIKETKQGGTEGSFSYTAKRTADDTNVARTDGTFTNEAAFGSGGFRFNIEAGAAVFVAGALYEILSSDVMIFDSEL